MSDALLTVLTALLIVVGVVVLIILLFVVHTLLYLVYYHFVSERYKYLLGHVHGQASYEFHNSTEPYVQMGRPIYDGNLIRLIKLNRILHNWSDVC